MKAYHLIKSGKPAVLKQKNVEKPEISSNEVLIKVQTIGVNYAEILSRQGKYSWAPPRPYIPGMECFGEVVAVGDKVNSVKPGEHYIVGGQYGSYAEYIKAPEHLIFKSFSNFTPEENAAVLVNFMTAWVALVRQARIMDGDKVLVQAAAGGVGTAAIQIAKSMGCHVTALASKPEKLELARSLGADLTINYSEEDFLSRIKDELGGIDVVLELVGGKVFKDSIAALHPFGRIAVAGYASIPFQKWNPFSWYVTWKNAPRIGIMKMARASLSLSATHIGYLTQNPQLTAMEWSGLFDFIEKNQLKPHVGHIFDFDELQKAHSLMESRQSMGKIVLKI